ncbi:MAG: alpha/beta hydrolase [Ruminococcus sp.]|nr:alpha/beta hydrolase [Ruminococcus sp.]
MKTGSVTIRDNAVVEYFTFGTGERAFIILPGIDVKSILPAAKNIEAAYRDFKEDYTVYVFDRRKEIPEGYTAFDMADDAASAIEALGIRGADIFGTSQGGMIAMMIAVYHPELVHALVLASTTAWKNPTVDGVFRRWIGFAEKRDITGLTADFIECLYSEKTIRNYRDFLMHMNDHVSDEALDRFIRLVKTIDTFDMRDKLSLIHCPTFVIGVEGDAAVSGESSREIARLIGCELYMYEGYGHCVFDEAPDYKQRLLDFYRKHR